jgi:hypothetical protein
MSKNMENEPQMTSHYGEYALRAGFIIIIIITWRYSPT